MSETAETPQPEIYLRLLAEHERGLSTYVRSLVPNGADADDILQDCKIALWKQFDQFELGTSFQAWARKIALHRILNYRRVNQRRPIAAMDENFIEAVAAEIDRASPQLEARSEALKSCLKKLPQPQRQLVIWRYYDEDGIEGIARKAKRTEGAVYRALSRIRGLLNDCISRTLKRTQTP